MDTTANHDQLLDLLTAFAPTGAAGSLRAEPVEGRDMPQPYRDLLVHDHDMTSTLEAHYERAIRLHVLGHVVRDNVLLRRVVLAAGTYGTQRLLFKMRDTGRLPQLSDRLGVLTRTNSESIVGAGRLEVSPDMDLTHGVAITSSIHPTADTHVEPCRYGKGSNAMGLLQTLMTDGAGPLGTDVPRWRQLLQLAATDPRGMLRMLNPRRWSERTVIALVMQHLDNSITTFTKRDRKSVV